MGKKTFREGFLKSQQVAFLFYYFKHFEKPRLKFLLFPFRGCDLDKIFRSIFSIVLISKMEILKEPFYGKHTLAYGKKKIFKDKLFQRSPKLNQYGITHSEINSSVVHV